MSGQSNEQLIILNRKLDEFLGQYKNLKAELKEVKNVNEDLQSVIQRRDEQIKELENKYERIKLTGALLGESGNAIEAKRKLTDLVREIDKCVALLNR